jgi:hypothetical protein
MPAAAAIATPGRIHCFMVRFLLELFFAVRSGRAVAGLSVAANSLGRKRYGRKDQPHDLSTDGPRGVLLRYMLASWRPSDAKFNALDGST